MQRIVNLCVLYKVNSKTSISRILGIRLYIIVVYAGLPKSLVTYVRLRNPQFAEEEVTHYIIVVLSRVDKHCMNVLVPVVLSHQRRYFHEIWPGANYI